MKALIAGHERPYPFTHDLGRLVGEAEKLGERLPLGGTDLDRLTEYVGIWRYQAPEEITSPQREAMITFVASLRKYVVERLAVLREQ